MHDCGKDAEHVSKPEDSTAASADDDDLNTTAPATPLRGVNMADKDVRDLEDWYDWVNDSANKPAQWSSKSISSRSKVSADTRVVWKVYGSDAVQAT